LREAKAELRTYARLAAAQAEAAAARQLRSSTQYTLTPAGISFSTSFQGLGDEVLVDRLLTLLGQVPMGEGSGGERAPLTLQEAMRRVQEVPPPPRVLPLTW